jgi:hypothetical protein
VGTASNDCDHGFASSLAAKGITLVATTQLTFSLMHRPGPSPIVWQIIPQFEHAGTGRMGRRNKDRPGIGEGANKELRPSGVSLSRGLLSKERLSITAHSGSDSARLPIA